MSQILIKRSAVAAKVPLTTDLSLGELAINTNDGKLYLKKNVGGTDSIVLVNDPAISPVQSVAGRTGTVVLTSTDVGLANVENKSSATIRSEITSANVTTGLGFTPVNTAVLGAANGVSTLGSDGKIVSSQLPALAITDTFVVATQAAMLALTAQTGDVAVRTDLNKSFILKGAVAATLADWQELLTPTDAVLSVNGQTGAVTLTTSNVTEGTNLYHTSARASAAAPVQSVAGRTGAVVLTSTDVGLNLVENKSSATIRGEITSGNVTTALGYTPVSKTGDTITGSLVVTAGVTTTASYGHRMKQGAGTAGYGTIHYVDSSNYHLMFTALNDADGTYSSLRPLYANFATGVVTMGHGLVVNGTTSANSFTGAGTGLTGTAASLSIGGNAATATNATNATNVAITTDETFASAQYLTMNRGGGGFAPQYNSGKLWFTPSTSTLSVTGTVVANYFSGAGTGLTGTAPSLNIGGNSATVTSITSGQVTTALGFTPYNSTNPSMYQGKGADIPGSADFDLYVNHGVFYQNSDAQAATCLNCPVPVSGKLTVSTGNTSIGYWQEYETYKYNNSRTRTFKRQRYSSTWSPWIEVAMADLVSAVNPATAKTGDIKVVGSVISIYDGSAWKQVFPAVYA